MESGQLGSLLLSYVLDQSNTFFVVHSRDIGVIFNVPVDSYIKIKVVIDKNKGSDVLYFSYLIIQLIHNFFSEVIIIPVDNNL